jgi:hypothetical protein
MFLLLFLSAILLGTAPTGSAPFRGEGRLTLLQLLLKIGSEPAEAFEPGGGQVTVFRRRGV